MPPVTRTLPSVRIETPGQNMSCAVLLTVAPVTWPVVRSSTAVWVYGDAFEPSKFMEAASSADHRTSRLPGTSAAATGMIGKPIVAPQLPTVAALAAAAALAITVRTPLGRPARTIRATATARSEDDASDRAVSRTARTVRGWKATFFTVAFADHRPYATGAPKCTPSVERVTRNRPIRPGDLRPLRGVALRPDTTVRLGQHDRQRLRKADALGQAGALPVGRSVLAQHGCGAVPGHRTRRGDLPAAGGAVRARTGSRPPSEVAPCAPSPTRTCPRWLSACRLTCCRRPMRARLHRALLPAPRPAPLRVGRRRTYPNQTPSYQSPFALSYSPLKSNTAIRDRSYH